MIKPEIRLLEPQQTTETTPININSPEVQALLAKYGSNGYINNQPTQIPIVPDVPNTNDLTFEEMVALEEAKLKAEKQRKEAERQKEMNKPTPYSFDKRNIQFYESGYRSDGEGFGMDVKIVSNMPIDKGYGY